MEVMIVHEASVVYEFLKDKIRCNYIYQFSNLEPKEWKKIICYGLYEGSELKEIAMLCTKYDIPVLLAASFENKKYNTELIRRIKEILPANFYTHIDRETLENVFCENHISESEELMNMGLYDYNTLNEKRESEAVRMGFDDLTQIKDLLISSYPEAWLDDELVKLNKNFGIRDQGKLISFAGLHAYSKEYQVAAVAHVTTHPDYRKKGYGEQVVASLSSDLKDDIKYIGLNVKTDNFPAINCYRKLGFREFGSFIACMIRSK